MAAHQKRPAKQLCRHLFNNNPPRHRVLPFAVAGAAVLGVVLPRELPRQKHVPGPWRLLLRPLLLVLHLLGHRVPDVAREPPAVRSNRPQEPPPPRLPRPLPKLKPKPLHHPQRRHHRLLHLQLRPHHPVTKLLHDQLLTAHHRRLLPPLLQQPKRRVLLHPRRPVQLLPKRLAK